MKIFTASITDFMDYSPSTYTVGVYSTCFNAFLALMKELNQYDIGECVGNINVGVVDEAKSLINLTYYPKRNEWRVSSTPTGSDVTILSSEVLNAWLLDDKPIISEANEYIATHSKPL